MSTEKLVKVPVWVSYVDGSKNELAREVRGRGRGNASAVTLADGTVQVPNCSSVAGPGLAEKVVGESKIKIFVPSTAKPVKEPSYYITVGADGKEVRERKSKGKPRANWVKREDGNYVPAEPAHA